METKKIFSFPKNIKINTSNPWLLRIAVITVLILLIANTFLLRHYFKTVNRADQQQEKSIDQKLASLELEAAYQKSINELNEFRSDNDSMNILIEEQKAQLTQQRERIASLLDAGENPEILQAEIEKFKAQSQKYLRQIEQLQKENEALLVANEGLTQQSYQLKGKVQKFEGIIKNQDSLASQLKRDSTTLAREKEELISQKEKIERDKTTLTRALNKAAIIGVGQFKIIPQIERKNNKFKENNKAQKIDQFSFCFNMQMNTQIKEGAMEVFQILLKNREGKVVTNKEGEYLEINATDINTLEASFEYGINKKACASWKPNSNLIQPGKYFAEIYNKGFLVGQDSITIR